MTTVSELAANAREYAEHYTGCSTEQSMTYACEDVVADALGARLINEGSVAQWLDEVCNDEDVDTPLVVVNNRSQRTAASVDIRANVMCIKRATTTAVLLHEIAHVATGSQVHGQVFRSALVRLWRRHLSVEHAALLHQLFTEVELSVDPWQVVR